MDPLLKKYMSEKYGVSSPDPEDEVIDGGVPAPSPVAPDYSKQYAIPAQFSDDARASIVAENTKNSSGPDFLAGLAHFGAGLAGQNGAQAAKMVLDRQAEPGKTKLDEFDRSRTKSMQDLSFKRESIKAGRDDERSDPNSSVSLATRKVYGPILQKGGMDPASIAGMSATEIDSFARQPLEYMSRSKDREMQARILGATKQQALADKREVKDEKKRTMLNEIEDRRQNINSALTSLDSMIEDKGTWEYSGSHNQGMDRLVEQVATDMAKLMDPNSVARPSEVDAVKKTLVSPGFSNTNDTARDVLKEFRGEVERRADSAYKIRGMDAPAKANQSGAQGSPGMVKMQAPDGSVREVREDQVKKYEAKGGKRV